MESDTFDDFTPRNGWAVAAMIVFAIAFFAFLVSIFIYETQRDKPKPWWCWVGFIISIILLVLAFATFAFINIGGTKGYHHRIRHAPDWESRKVQIIDPADISTIQTRPVYTQPQSNVSTVPTSSVVYAQPQSNVSTVPTSSVVYTQPQSNSSVYIVQTPNTTMAPVTTSNLSIPTQHLT